MIALSGQAGGRKTQMIFLVTVLIALSLVVVYSIFRDLFKRKQLGNIIMKVKYDIQSYLLILLMVISGIVVVYITISRVNLYILSDFYGIKEISLVIANSTVYMFIYMKLCIGIITSKEIREKGITLARCIINYSDIRGIHWLNEKKIQINYDPGYVSVFNRQFKEKWVVKDNQIAELKQIFQEKYYDSF